MKLIYACAATTAIITLIGCGSESMPPIDGGGGSATLDAGADAATDAPTGVYYDASSAELFPAIPDGCYQVSDAGLGPNYAEYDCPASGPQATDCFPLKQPPPGFPLRWDCPLSTCFEGCTDVPCPTAPCPLSAPHLWTCGPMAPHLADGCIVLTKTTAQDAGLMAGRYAICCADF
jgi:hypothetical protein